MANELSEDELNDIDPDEHSNPNLVKTLRDQARRTGRDARQAQEELAQARREAAALRAGIDPDSRLGRVFLADYQGDLNDRTKLASDYLAFQKELGVAPAASTSAGEPGSPAPEGSAGQTPEGQQPAGETTMPPAETGTRERDILATNAPPADLLRGDAASDILSRGRQALAEGATFDEAAGGVINAIANAVHAGELAPLNRDGTRPQL